MSVEFEPVKLGPRRRRIDPVAIGALVVTLGLLAAVVKPWNGETAPAASGLDGGAIDGADVPSAPVPVLPRALTASTAALASPDMVRAAIRPHEGWGIRAVVAEPSPLLDPAATPRFAEIWDALPDDGNGASVDIEPNDRTVVAIGLTFPAAHAPLDARIWLVHPDRLEWIDTLPIDADPTAGAYLYRVANLDGSVRNWAAGRYRVDVLVDGAIRRFGFTLPNQFEFVPDRAEPLLVPDGLVDPANSALPDLPIGLFATTGGGSISLAGEEGPALDEAGAWLDVDPGTGREPRSFVAVLRLSSATGLGVMLPPGSVIQAAGVSRLAPEPFAAQPVRVRDEGSGDTATAHVLYRPPGGGAWQPGVYRFSVTWADAAGLHDRSWHLELRPGPLRERPPLLLATRGFARYAGERGIVVGSAEPLEGGPRSVAIRLLHPHSPASAPAPTNDPTTCDGIRVNGFTGIAGVAYPDKTPPSVTARALYDSSRSVVQPLLTAARNTPGLELVVPIGDLAPASYVYRLRVGGETGTPATFACLWIAPAS